MAQFESSYARDVPDDTATGFSVWAIAYLALASVLMLLSGSFHFMMGLAAILNGDFYTIRDGYDLKMNVSLWGWLNVVGGTVIAFAGGLLLTGMLWTRITCMAMAILSTIWAFYSIPYYSVWPILIIVLNIGVIWALAKHGKELEEL